jgi:hypothetical protein
MRVKEADSEEIEGIRWQGKVEEWFDSGGEL